MSLRLAAAAATAVGPMPGTSAREASAVVAGELGLLPYLPQLPARGPLASDTARGAAVLVGQPLALATTGGWVTSMRDSRELMRARSYLAEDVECLAEALSGYSGIVKVAVAGPFDLARQVRLRTADPLASDRSAYLDLSQSLALGLVELVGAVHRVVPDATVLLQLDEVDPAAEPASSGGGWLARPTRLVSADTVADGWRVVLAAVRGQSPALAGVALRLGGSAAAVAAARGAGFDAAWVDASGLGERSAEDALGAALEAGLVLLAGVVAVTDPDPEPAARAVADLWHRLGLTEGSWAGQVALTPQGGLADLPQTAVRPVLVACRKGAARLAEGGSSGGG